MNQTPGARQIRAEFPALLGAGFLLLCGCNIDKIANRMDGPHFPTGHNDAAGGVAYFASGLSGKEWSRTVFTCRSSIPGPGLVTIRLGASTHDLPLTLTEDSKGIRSVQLDSPDGPLTFDRSSCDDLKTDPLPTTNTLPPMPGNTGKLTFTCKSGTRFVQGSVEFNDCGN